MSDLQDTPSPASGPRGWVYCFCNSASATLHGDRPSVVIEVSPRGTRGSQRFSAHRPCIVRQSHPSYGIDPAVAFDPVEAAWGPLPDGGDSVECYFCGEYATDPVDLRISMPQSPLDVYQSHLSCLQGRLHPRVAFDPSILD